jgi:hypothetical protein
VKGRSPYKTAVGLQFHAEEWVWQTGKVVVVDARVHKGRWETDAADVVLHRELGTPQRQGRPIWILHGMVGHGAVDVVLDAGPLRRIGQRASNGYLVAPESCIYKGQLGAFEEQRDEGLILQVPHKNLDIWQVGDFLRHDAVEIPQLRAHMVSDRAGDPDQRSSLTTARVHHGDSLARHKAFALGLRVGRVLVLVEGRGGLRGRRVIEGGASRGQGCRDLCSARSECEDGPRRGGGHSQEEYTGGRI